MRNTRSATLSVMLLSLINAGCANTPQQPPIIIQQPAQTQTVPVPYPSYPLTATQSYSQCVSAYNSRDYDSVVIKCSETVSLAPEHADAYIKLGEAYQARGETGSAISAYLNAANILARQKRCEEPRNLYYRILALSPNHIDATRGLNSLSCRGSSGMNIQSAPRRTYAPPKRGGETLKGGGAWIE